MGNQYTQYSSTDGSAPAYTGLGAGTLLAIYDACLVNGFGSKAAAGWTKPFTGTNQAVYRAPSGLRHYLNIDDSGAGAAINVFGFETMSAYNTGTGQFPTGAQLSTSAILKTSTASSPWYMFADARSFIFFLKNTTNSNWGCFYFGELFALQSGDSYGTLIRTNNQSGGVCYASLISTSIASATNGAYMPRGYSAVGTSVQVAVTGDGAKSGSATKLQGIVPLPNPEEGGLYLSPLWVSDPTTSPANNIRGRMRGFWHCLHPNTSIVNGTTYTGIGDLAGRTFFAITPADDGGVTGTSCYMIETSATLETN